jgi:hypothetical protein
VIDEGQQAASQESHTRQSVDDAETHFLPEETPFYQQASRGDGTRLEAKEHAQNRNGRHVIEETRDSTTRRGKKEGIRERRDHDRAAMVMYDE